MKNSKLNEINLHSNVIITIDGPAGSGKSSAARGLAARLRYEFLDTGAMYRVVAIALNEANIPLDSDRVAEFLTSLHIHMDGQCVYLNNRDVSQEIRSAEVAAQSSKVAAIPSVRQYLVELQRSIAKGRNIVSEGRDQGTVVFPGADCKFYFNADIRVRAQRRLSDLLKRGEKISLEMVIAEQEERDQRDSTRNIGPLKPAHDAILIDTSFLSIEEVLDRLEEETRRCLRG